MRARKRSMRTTTFDAGACLDLGAFDPARPDAGVAAWLDDAQAVPSWVVVMEDRQPTFFHGYRGFDPSAPAPLNRHGPRRDAWTHADLKRLVDAFHARGVRVLLGYWVHESGFVDDEHPELLIRDATGRLWQDRQELNADFSPLRRMRADAANDVREGERYATWSARRYAQLARDFGFDGLFLGDGAMGFRRHGMDWKDLRHFDYHEDWLAEFQRDVAFDHHDGCALGRADASTSERVAEVHARHWDHWVQWNVDRWTAYYREMAAAVHATGGILAAYNTMNYDPSIARLHGVDYRAIAEAGLDVLVFQAYDYAWGPLGPFGELHIARKDLHTNLRALLRTRAHVGYDTRMKIVVTVETEDEVERWDAPEGHTLGEAYAYGHAVAHDGESWRRAADGAFIVWGNSVLPTEWRALRACFDTLGAEPAAPRAALVWDEQEAERLARRGVPTEREPDEIYAHFADEDAIGDGRPETAIVTRRHVETARRQLRPPAASARPSGRRA